MNVGGILSMWLPMDPQRIDFKTYSGFTDGVLPSKMNAHVLASSQVSWLDVFLKADYASF